MANHPDDLSTYPGQLLAQPHADELRADFARARSRLEQARADLSRTARSTASGAPSPQPETETDPPAAAPAVYDPAAVAARIDLMRGRFGRAREDAISALLFLSDAQQDCDALAEAATINRWALMGAGIDLLHQSLRRAMPGEAKHFDLIGLLIDALYALRRAETRPDMGRAGEDLLRGLRLATARELPATDS